MASTPATICRYFANNCCHFGDECRFIHDRSAPVDNVCRYYLQGQCSYGSRCRFDHIRPRSSQTTPTLETINVSSNVSTTPTSKSATPMSDSKLRPDAKVFVPRILSTNTSSASLTNQSDQSGLDIQTDFNGRSYVNALGVEVEDCLDENVTSIESKQLICPYHIMGHCWYGENCTFIHGEICDMCYRPVLHPTDKEHNAKHHKECLAEHEKEMEKAFATAISADKQCGVCMEVVMDKKPPKCRFGVLQNCKHVFCLECIRKWRQSQQFENQIIRACPECRTLSDFVIPSSDWVEEQEQKDKLIASYKSNLNTKPCKYFKSGSTEKECQFGNKCFYRHEAPDGTLVRGDSPRVIRRRLMEKQRARRRERGDDFVMWDFLHERRILGDSFHSSNMSFDDSDDEGSRLHNVGNVNVDWMSDDDSDDDEDELWLLRALQHELNFLSISSVRRQRDPPTGEAGGASASNSQRRSNTDSRRRSSSVRQ